MSLMPSPVGEITGSDAWRPASVRSTTTSAAFVDRLASRARRDGEPVAAVGQDVRAPDERVRPGGPRLVQQRQERCAARVEHLRVHLRRRAERERDGGRVTAPVGVRRDHARAREPGSVSENVAGGGGGARAPGLRACPVATRDPGRADRPRVAALRRRPRSTSSRRVRPRPVPVATGLPSRSATVTVHGSERREPRLEADRAAERADHGRRVELRQPGQRDALRERRAAARRRGCRGTRSGPCRGGRRSRAASRPCRRVNFALPPEV